MKIYKKVIPFLLAIVMVMGMSFAAFAANDGSITVTNATVGETYTVYKVFDLTYNETPAVTDPDTGEVTTPASTQVAYTYGGENATFLAALQGEDSPFVLTGAGPYNVALKDGKEVDDVINFLKAQETNLSKTAEEVANSSTVDFEGLSYGYYYVTSTLGSLVTINSTTKNVEIVDKNQVPSWDNEDPDNPDPDFPDNPGKVIVSNGTKVIDNSVNYGDTVDFSIAINATAYNGTKLVTHYHIKDVLGDGFSEADNIKVYVGGEEIEDTDYTIEQSGNTFEIVIPFGLKYGSGAKIEVTYSATVLNTADVVLAGEGNPNTAYFTWTEKDFDPEDPPFDPDPDDPDYPDPDPDPPYPNTAETHTYVYAIGIRKVDTKGNPLTGAEFTISDSEGNAVYATGSAGVYNYCKSDADGAVSQFVTDGNGLLVIKGVAAGEYQVTEAVAPLGYNLLLSPVTVKAELKQAYTTTITTYFDESGNVTETETETKVDTDTGVNVTGIVVVNNAGTELPATGGMGTTFLYIIGGLLVVGAGVFLFVRKRMDYNK